MLSGSFGELFECFLILFENALRDRVHPFFAELRFYDAIKLRPVSCISAIIYAVGLEYMAQTLAAAVVPHIGYAVLYAHEIIITVYTLVGRRKRFIDGNDGTALQPTVPLRTASAVGRSPHFAHEADKTARVFYKAFEGIRPSSLKYSTLILYGICRLHFDNGGPYDP